MQKIINKCVVITIALTMITNVAIAQKKVPAKPNVIFILADDLGRGMLSYYGQKIVKTPNIDRIAHEGVSFDRSYAGVYCAPSRASLITGYSNFNYNNYTLTRAGIYIKEGKGELTDAQVQAKVDSAIGQEPDITYLPQVFKQAGYITAEVGKLDYGFATSTKQMNNHGWDYYYGYYDHQMCHGFYPPFLHETGTLVKIPGNTHPDAAKESEWGDEAGEKARWNMEGKAVYSQDLFLDKMLTFIRNNKNKPFFLFHPTQLPHGPAAIPNIYPEFASNPQLTEIEKVYASMVKKLDDNVGVILDELKRQGMDENTIVIFSSDNGHQTYYSTKGRIEKPHKNMQTGKVFDNVTTRFYSDLAGDVFDGNDGMAGLKMSNWEGGARVPLFVRWPGKFKEGYKAPQMIANYDLMTTMADLLQVETKDKKDGISYLPALYGSKKFEGNKDVSYVSFIGPALITRDGWKIRYQVSAKTYELYYLPNDYKEADNLAIKSPEKLAELKKLILDKCKGNIDNGWFREGLRIKAVN